MTMRRSWSPFGIIVVVGAVVISAISLTKVVATGTATMNTTTNNKILDNPVVDHASAIHATLVSSLLSSSHHHEAVEFVDPEECGQMLVGGFYTTKKCYHGGKCTPITKHHSPSNHNLAVIHKEYPVSGQPIRRQQDDEFESIGSSMVQQGRCKLHMRPQPRRHQLVEGKCALKVESEVSVHIKPRP
jgi:hypothetical protein